MLIFAPAASREFAASVAKALGQPLAGLEERDFEDGEHKVRPMVSVRGADAYVIQSLHGGPDQSCNDKLCRLLFLIATLRDHGARRVTAVTPYLAYARKDRRTKSHDPLTLRYVAQLFEAVGTDRIVTLEAHNLSAFENAFRVPALSLSLGDILGAQSGALDAMLGAAPEAPIVIASPDPGGVKRAQLLRETLESRLGREIGAAFMEKRRSAGVVTGSLLAGDVTGAHVLLVDDLVASGGTLLRAARACLEAGASGISGLAAHGLFVGDASTTLSAPELSRLIVSDTVPPFRLTGAFRPQIVSAATGFADAIRRLAGDRTRPAAP